MPDGLPPVPDLDDPVGAAGPRGAGQDLAADGRGILAARVVVSDDDQVGQLGGDLAHRRSLARVALAAGAEHHRQPAFGAPQCGERRPQRARLVGVVDQRQELLAAVDLLEPAGHPCFPQPRRGLFRRDPDHVQDCQGHKAIGDVVVAGQRYADPVVNAGRVDDGELLSPGTHRGDVHGAPVGGLPGRADGHRVPDPGGHGAPGVVVDAHHGAAGAQRRTGIEQHRLGLEVVGHGGVKVQVVAGQVGESAHREVGAVDAAQRQRVAGDLHHHGVHPTFGHHREHRLQRGCLGRGERAGDVLAVDADADGADQAGRASPGAQAGLDQIGGGGLAGRPGDADDSDAVRWVPVHGGGEAA